MRIAAAPAADVCHGRIRAVSASSWRCRPKCSPNCARRRGVPRRKGHAAGDDLVNISRLLGLHNRLKNQAAGDRRHRAHGGHSHGALRPRCRRTKTNTSLRLARWWKAWPREFGLQYRNVDNRIFEVKLPGSGPKSSGILTHADVVPVVADEWVLDDGTKLDPFKLTRVGGNLYGRGSIDDKGLHRHRTVRDEGREGQRPAAGRTIRLMIETT